MQAIKLYNFPRSGHAHRVELMLSLLQLPTELILVDLAKGEHKQAPYLAINSFGQVPAIDDDGVVLADSNAILVYLAKRYGGDGWLPTHAADAAAVQRFLGLAAGPMASGLAAARLAHLFGARLNLEEAMARGHTTLALLERALQEQSFLVAKQLSIADIACYTYVWLAPEGGLSLQPYPAVRDWLARIEALPGFVPMRASAVGLRA